MASKMRSRIKPVVVSLLLAAGSRTVYAFPSSEIHAHNVTIRWNSAVLQGIRDAKLGALSRARLGVVHTCMYDAWSAYDDRAVGTQLRGALRRPASERTLATRRSH